MSGTELALSSNMPLSAARAPPREKFHDTNRAYKHTVRLLLSRSQLLIRKLYLDWPQTCTL